MLSIRGQEADISFRGRQDWIKIFRSLCSALETCWRNTGVGRKDSSWEEIIMLRKQYRIIGLVILLPMVFGGCAAAVIAGSAAAGAGTWAFLHGELQTTERASLNRVWDATQKAVESMEFEIKKREKDALSAKITSLDSRKRFIVVRLSSESANETTIKIRVGTFGDETASEQILKKIQLNLM